MLWNDINFHNFQEGWQAYTHDGLSDTLTVLTNFHPPIPDFLNDFDDFFELTIWINFDERNGHGSELCTIEDRGFRTNTYGTALVSTRTKRGSSQG